MKNEIIKKGEDDPEMDDIIDFSSYQKGKELLKKYDIII